MILLRILAVTIAAAPIGSARQADAGRLAHADRVTAPAPRGTLTADTSRPFGIFGGTPYDHHSGFFEGETSRGRFRVLYVLIAPSDHRRGNGTVLVEPPHPNRGAVGRDEVLGRELLFGRGFSYAGVGWSNSGRALLNPATPGMVVAGQPPIPMTPLPNPAVIADEEILIQFTEALTVDPTAIRILGPIQRRYAYGVSATTEALLELQRRVAAGQRPPLFDLTVLHAAIWGVSPAPWMWEFLSGEFEPVNAGRVMFVLSEGDLIISDAEQFRRSADLPSYRIYEVAGASHLPTDANPLDHGAIARAMFIAGDLWVRSGIEPPPSTQIEASRAGETDPLYERETGIARDADRNARGGVRLPDIAIGRARFVASDITSVPPGFPPMAAFLTGSMVDLACEPSADVPANGPRFRDVTRYRSAVKNALDDLKERRFLLDADALEIERRAVEREPARCPT